MARRPLEVQIDSTQVEHGSNGTMARSTSHPRSPKMAQAAGLTAHEAVTPSLDRVAKTTLDQGRMMDVLLDSESSVRGRTAHDDRDERRRLEASRDEAQALEHVAVPDTPLTDSADYAVPGSLIDVSSSIAPGTVPEPLGDLYVRAATTRSDAQAGEGAGGVGGLGLGSLFALAAGAGLAMAGGGRSSAGIAPREPAQTTLELINGYISGATVWQDDNRNGVLDAGERSALTDASGKVTLVVDPDGGPIRSTGGTDLSTGQPVTNDFASPADALVITPLTTLVSAAMESGASLSQALADTRRAFGLDASTDLMRLDPVEASMGTGAAAAQALKVKAAAVQVANLMDLGASLLDGAGSAVEGSAAMARAIAQAVKTASTAGVDLSSADQIKSVMVEASRGAGLAADQLVRVNAVVDSVAVVAATANTLVADAAQASDAIESLSLMARAQRIAQVEASAAVQAAVAQNGSSAALASDFGPAAFAQKASALTGGLISADRPVAVVEVLPLPVQPPKGSSIELPTLPPAATLSLVGNVAVTGLAPGSEAKIAIAVANFQGSLAVADLLVSGGLEVVGLESVSGSRYVLTVRATGTTLGEQSVTLREAWAGAGTSVSVKPVSLEIVDRFDVMGFEEQTARLEPFEGAQASIVELSDGNAVAQFTKPTGAAAYAGMTVALNPANGLGVLPVTAADSKLALWVHAPQAGMPIRLQLASTTAGKVHQYLNSSFPLMTDDRDFVEAETLTTQSGWQRMEFDFAQPMSRWVAVYGDSMPVALNPAVSYDQVSIFPDFNQPAAGEVFYFDGLSMASKTLTQPINPPQDFSAISFEGGAQAYQLLGFDGATGVLAVDPDDSGNAVLRVTKSNSPEIWAGVTIATESGQRVPTVNFQPGKSLMTADVWSEAAGTKVRLKLEDASDPAVSVETELVTTIAGWETLRFDFSKQVPGTAAIDLDARYDKLSVFFDFDVAASAGRSYLIDEIRFVDQPTELPGNPIPAGYSLVFADEFNTEGKTSPDFSVWTPDLGDGSKRNLAGWGNGEAQYYTTDLDNVFVENGSLHIVAKSNDTATNTQDRVNAQGQVVPFDVGITSARLTTRDWNLDPYGYLEVRAKLPAEKGAWPAIWMLGSQGTWPQSGEIDIVEWSGLYFNDQTVQAALHYAADYGNTQTKAQQTLPSSVERFHTYQLWWSPDEIRIGVDGDYDSAYFKYEKGENWDVSRWPFDGPFHLIMNVAVGGSLGGGGFDQALAVAPYQMEVDYVRLYQGEAAPSAPTTAPAVPTAVASDVVSLYSDAYTTTGGFDLPYWGQ
ncbi:MAG: Beta-glucanase precursor, partial [Pseudomonadota bacterium]